MGRGFEPVLIGSWIRKESVFREAVCTFAQRDPVSNKFGLFSSFKSRGSAKSFYAPKKMNISSRIAVAMFSLKVETPNVGGGGGGME